MRAKILSLALALTLCLGLAVPAFAEDTYTTNKGGITITLTLDEDQNRVTISYTGTGKLTADLLEYSVLLVVDRGFHNDNGWGRQLWIEIGQGITNEMNQGRMNQVINETYSQWGLEFSSINFGSAPQTFAGFTDVKESDYFADPVRWAVDKMITAGTSATTFSPNQNCTVAQIVSFLYRAYGSPNVNVSNPFSDVKSSDYYYDAARWANEKRIVTGSTFGGNRPCTRAMAVDYMWKAAGGPYADFEIKSDDRLYGYNGSSSYVVIPSTVISIRPLAFTKSVTSVAIPTSVTEIDWCAFDGDLTDVYYEGSEAQWQTIGIDPDNDALLKATIHYNSEKQPVETGFTDVPSTADYAEAVKWAVDKGVTAGTSATTFSPDSVCTRGQIVSFLYRALKK